MAFHSDWPCLTKQTLHVAASFQEAVVDVLVARTVAAAGATGIGTVADDVELGAAHVRPGDKVLVSGPLADHGMAVMLARGDLHLTADIVSDTAPLHGLVAELLEAAPATRFVRDATRGGVGTVLNELAGDTGLGIVLSEDAIPVRPTTLGACDLLGIDPLYVANEGRVVVVVPAVVVPAVAVLMVVMFVVVVPTECQRRVRLRRGYRSVGA